MKHRQHVLFSGLAAFVGLTLVAIACQYSGWSTSSLILVAPAGASAVLLFGAPSSPLSQPRAVLLSHLVAGVIGVSITRLLPPSILSIALAVALTLLIIGWLKCLHPPAGATALLAVSGGPEVQQLGYSYVLSPILLNVGLLVAAAYLINNLLPGRHYPLRPNLGPPLPEAGNPSKICCHIMQPARLVLKIGQPLSEAWQAMMNARVASAPVVDADCRVIGILLLTDLLHPRATGIPASIALIDPYLRTNVSLIPDTATVREAASLWLACNSPMLPVIANDGRLVGVLTRRSMLPLLVQTSSAA